MNEEKRQTSRLLCGEEFLINKGLYITTPINFQLLFTANELLVLNTIRFMKNLNQCYISLSLLVLYTGLSENTIRKAISSLEKMQYLSVIDNHCPLGRQFKIGYNKLLKDLNSLNSEGNILKRMKLSDELRGSGKEIHTSLIRQFKNSEFSFKL